MGESRLALCRTLLLGWYHKIREVVKMTSKMRSAESGFWMWLDMAWTAGSVAIVMIIVAIVLGVDL